MNYAAKYTALIGQTVIFKTIIFFLLLTSPCFAAPRFWVGGTATWDNSDTTHWSSSSGGGGGSSVPVAGDDVTFDAASGGGTVTMNYSPSINSITMGAFTGTLNDGGNNPTVATFSGTGTGVRAFTITGSWTVTGSSATVWDWTVTTNSTVTTTGSTITFTGSSVNFSANRSWGTLVFTGTGTHTTTGALPTVNLTIAPTGIASFRHAGMTISGVLTLAGLSQTQRLYYGSVNTTVRTTTVNGSFSISNVDIFNNIAAGTAGAWTGTSLGNAGGATSAQNTTYTTGVTRYWIGGTGNYSDITHWSASSGGAGSATMPIPQDTAVFDGSSFSSTGQTVTLDIAHLSELDFSLATNSPTLDFSSIANFAHGNIKFIPAMTVSGALSLNIQPPTSMTITSAGQSFPMQVFITPPNTAATITLNDSFVCANANAFTINSGTFNANNFNVTSQIFTSAGTLTRTINMGTGLWTMNRTSSTTLTAWSTTATGMTLNASTSTIKFAMTGGGVKTFAGSGLTYGTLWIDASMGNQTTITGSNTFANIRIDPGKTVNFTAGTTQTVTTAAGWQVRGNPGNVITLQSVTAASAWTLSIPSGFVFSDYTSLQDSTATGGAQFFVGAGSSNISGNTGWNFTGISNNNFIQDTSLIQGSSLLN